MSPLWRSAFTKGYLMAVPNHLHIIQGVYAAGSYNLATHDGCGQFIEASCLALHAADARWGHLKKNPGQTQYNGHSHDGCLYLSDTPGQSVHVDMIASAEAPNASVYWNPDVPRYSKSDWYAPSGGTVPGPDPCAACKSELAALKASSVPRVGYPGDAVWDEFGRVYEADVRRAGQTLNAQSFRWGGRTMHDDYMEGLTLQQSIDKHRIEWCALLGIPVQ